MKTFSKGTITTTVDDDDRRIPEYLASGWKETQPTKKPKDDADKRIENAVKAAAESESKGKGDKGKGKKKTAPDKKVNDAVAAVQTAEEESQVIDDGLLKTEGESNG
ncbi:MAG: hypothetical protein NC184_05645 [Roseburia sp.]|nr:hypothetical protein [Roseburia sp.]